MENQKERKERKKGEREGNKNGKGEKKMICLFSFLHKWHPKEKNF